MKKNIFLFLFLIWVLMMAYPFVFNVVIPSPPIVALIAISFVAFLFIVKKKNKVLSSPYAGLALCQTIGVLLCLLYSQDSDYFKQIMYIIWVVCFFGMVQTYGVKKFLFIYNRIILVVAILGTISFFLSYILGPNPIAEFKLLDGRTTQLVYFTFSNSNYESFIRYSGIFDEPGAMAGWGVFALLTNKLFVKDKIIEIPLIIALLFTLSLAYFIQILFYLFIFYILGHTSAKGYLIITAVAFIVLFLALNADSDSRLYRASFGRLGLGTAESFDNNRSDATDISKKLFDSSPLFGVGPTVVDKYQAYDNPYETLGKDGIIGTFFIYLPYFIALLLCRKNREVLFAILIVVMGYLQRPFHVQCIHYLMTYIFFYICMNIYKENKRKQYCLTGYSKNILHENNNNYSCL